MRPAAHSKAGDREWLVAVPAMAMEVVWTYAWVFWLSATLSPGLRPLAFHSCLLQAILTEAGTRRLLGKGWTARRIRLAALPALLALLAILVRLDQGGGYSLFDKGWLSYAADHLPLIVAGFAFGSYLTWRALSTVYETYSFRNLYRRFLTGLTGIVVLLVLSGLASRGPTAHSPSLGIFVIAYFGLGLLTLALANLATLRAQLVYHHEALAAFGRRWLSIIVALVLSVVFASLLITAILYSSVASVLLHGLNVAGGWLLVALYYLLLVPSALLFYVMWFFIRPITGGHLPSPEMMKPPSFSGITGVTQVQSLLGVPPWVFISLKWAVLALVACAGVLILIRTVGRYRQTGSREEVEEVHESLWSWSAFRTDLRASLLHLISWLLSKRPNHQGRASSSVPSLQPQGNVQFRSVRELYKVVLRLGGFLGIPRRPCETPSEYCSRLAGTAQTASADLEAITEAYMMERYGQMKPGEDEIVRLSGSLRAFFLQQTNRPSGISEDSDANR